MVKEKSLIATLIGSRFYIDISRRKPIDRECQQKRAMANRSTGWNVDDPLALVADDGQNVHKAQ